MDLSAIHAHLRASRTGNWDNCAVHMHEPIMKDDIFNLKKYGLQSKVTYTQAQRNWLAIDKRRVTESNPRTLKMITAQD